MAPKVPATVKAERVLAVLDRALELMNNSGAHWAQGEYRSDYPQPDGQYAYCSVGAILTAATNQHSIYALHGSSVAEREAREAVRCLAGAYSEKSRDHLDFFTSVNRVTRWNDSPDTNWEKVVNRFRRAKTLVRKLAKEGELA